MGNVGNATPNCACISLPGSSSMLNIAIDAMSPILLTAPGAQTYMAFSKNHSYHEPERPLTTSTSGK